jgi:predicted esterase
MSKLRFVSLIALCLSCLLTAGYAQDAPQVLRMSVGFRTLKNTAPMDEATKQQVLDLEKKATAANNAQKYGEAIKHMAQGMALMRKQPWTPLDAFKTALVIKPERLVFDPGETFNVKLSQLFALDEPLTEPLTISLALNRTREGKTETIKEIKTVPDAPANFTQPQTISGALPPNLGDGTYQMLLTLKPKTGEPMSRSMSIRIQRDLLAQAQLLNARLADLQKTNGRLSDPRMLVFDGNARTSPFHIYSGRAAYAAQLIDLINANELPLDRYNLAEEIANAHTLLDQLTTGRNPLYKKTGDIHWAYHSAVDNTPQPYRLFIPSKYDPQKKWPLIVALHGMGGNENSMFDGYNKGVVKEEAEKRGYLIVCPKGRGIADMYLGNAQKDVFDALAHVRQLYNIDADRIYLMGHSMGGYGSWIVSTTQPEIFAAIAPFSGGGLPMVIPALKKIAHVPWFVVHGDADPTVNVEESRKMVKAGKELGIEIIYKEIPGGDHRNVVVPQFKEMFDFFDAHKRQAPKAQVKAAGSGQ